MGERVNGWALNKRCWCFVRELWLTKCRVLVPNSSKGGFDVAFWDFILMCICERFRERVCLEVGTSHHKRVRV